jgi:Zn-dependent protease
MEVPSGPFGCLVFANIDFQTIVVSYLALLFSLCVHEASHATMAYWLEDDTAARLGRMTLNPLAHIDPIGTVLFPLIGMTTGFPMIGWAKPVPVNVNRLTRRFNMRTGYAFVAAAGPASNVVLAILATLALTLGLRATVPDFERGRFFIGALSGFRTLEDLGVSPATGLLLALAGRLVIINFLLAVFNMLPVGPLDGGGVLRAFLPYKAAQWFDHHVMHMYIALIALFYLGGLDRVFGFVYRHYVEFLLLIAPTLLGV